MARHLISSGSPFERHVGYSRAVVDGDWCFVAGTTGPDTDGSFPDDVASQTRNALAIIKKALEEGGFGFEDVVRATYYITDIAHAEPFLAVCGETFGEIRPATTLLIVAGLYKPEMKVEIEVTAKLRT